MNKSWRNSKKPPSPPFLFGSPPPFGPLWCLFIYIYIHIHVQLRLWALVGDLSAGGCGRLCCGSCGVLSVFLRGTCAAEVVGACVSAGGCGRLCCGSCGVLSVFLRGTCAAEVSMAGVLCMLCCAALFCYHPPCTEHVISTSY